MSVDTKAYINSKYDLKDVQQFLGRHCGEVKIESHHDFAPGYFTFTMPKIGRMIHVHSHSETPIGPCTLLVMNSDEQGQEIMRSVCDTFGGLFMAEDTSGNIDMISGKLTTEDGLPYFVQYAILQDGIEADDFHGLVKSMSQWYDECDKGRKPAPVQVALNALEHGNK